MKFRHELTYDASPREVFEMLADPAFREASCAAQDVVSVEVDLQRDGDAFTLVADQVQKTDDLPSFARTFAGHTTRAIQREEWTDDSGGSLRIETPGKPADIAGTITLLEDGSGTREVVELEVKVKLPLIGGKIEKLLAEKVAAGMDAEHGAGVAWLAGDR
ncbi:MAG: DUF2505 domain-containing protein [Nocardioides sp.]|nr:DUF2505 domain-containing protein [Nocardioidaceae bacterium]MCB8958222.1 DUF2505 domain-containing protein [Nocardioides sp.]